MRDALYWLLLLIVAAVAGSSVYARYQATRPCVMPIAYSIGAVDSRFDIATSTLLREAEAATLIWNKAEGKTLLTYDPKAALKLNLIYDSREATARLGVKIATEQAAASAERASLDAARAQFTARQDAYNQEVAAVNARGGATRSEMVALESERAALAALQDSINQSVASYNANVNALNAVVREYNQAAGHSFKEGEYVRDASGERIDVFEFIGATQLERVLAHEFGHALGLGHNDDPTSIMYAQNESGNLTPTKADLAALQALCGS